MNENYKSHMRNKIQNQKLQRVKQQLIWFEYYLQCRIISQNLMGCVSACQKFFSRNTRQLQSQMRQANIKRINQGQGSTAKALVVDKFHQTMKDDHVDQATFNYQINTKKQITKDSIMRKHRKSRGDETLFYEMISQDIANFYMNLTKEYLQLINSQQITQNQLKIQFSEQVLILSLRIFEVIGMNKNFHYRTDTFQKYNQLQAKLIGYLKMKYPRSGNVFIPGDFADKFKQFDMTNMYQNDILENSGVFFHNSQKIQVINKLKTFFNIIFEQLDKKFPIFRKLLQQQIFCYSDEGVTKNLNYKIGRKIPENISRFQMDKSQQMTINSPQLFRTIIKWVEDLQDQISNPEKILKQRSTFKIYRQSKLIQLQKQVVNVEQIEEIIPTLIQNYKYFTQSYQRQIKQLKQQINIFNISLIKIMYTSERRQKFVPRSDSNIITYAFYNTKVVSWVIVQMLVFLIQKLIEIGRSVKFKDRFINIDLVTFPISDLMRSNIIGSKKQLSAVFENILNLQKRGQLKVIKIKNRLGTLLNDAMIIFTIKESFLICQLQLILSEGQNVSDRQKNTQFLNHFLYQLQRSPYGVISQAAVVLGFKDSKVGYGKKLNYSKGSLFISCEKNHPQNITRQDLQKKPIICISCSQYYNPFQNIIAFKKCQRCNTFQCCTCTYSKNKVDRLKQLNIKFSNAFQKKIFMDRQPNIFISLFIYKLFMKQWLQLREICKYLDKSSLSGAQLHRFIIQKKHLEIIVSEEFQKQSDIFFILVQFKASLVKLTQFFWNKQIQQFQNCFNDLELMSEIKKINLSEYDFIIFYETQKIVSISTKSQEKQKMMLLSLQQITDKKNIQKYHLVPMFANFAFVLRYQKNNDKYMQGLRISKKSTTNKKRFTLKSLKQSRKKLPNLIYVKENLVMPNSGITNNHLQNFFAEMELFQKQIIRQVNLSDNLISDVSDIFLNCPNLKKVILCKNFIKSINFKNTVCKNIQSLIVNHNILSELTNLRELQNLTKLKVNNNQFLSFEKLNLPKLQQLNIENNKLDSLQWLQKSNLPNLKTLQVSNSGISSTLQHSTQSLTFSFPKLINFGYNQNITGLLNIESQNLEYLSANKCKLKRLYLPLNKIVYLSICNNDIQNLDEILSVNMPYVNIIRFRGAGNLPIFPLINAPNLIQLQVSSCNITNAKLLGTSQIQNIQQINLSFNYDIEKIPEINFPKLKKFNTEGLRLKNINFLEGSDLQKLQELKLCGQSQQFRRTTIFKDFHIPLKNDFNLPNFRIQNLKSLQFSNFRFANLSNISAQNLPELRSLTLQKITVKQLNQMNFRNLESLKLQELFYQTASQIQLSQLPGLKSLTLKQLNIQLFLMLEGKNRLQRLQCSNLNIIILQAIRIQTLKSLSLNKCRIENISLFNQNKLPNLSEIDFSNNNIEQLPSFHFQNLTKLRLARNKILILDEFSNSTSRRIQYLDLSQNQIKFFPQIKFLKLKYFKFDFNPIQNLEQLSKINLQYLNEFRLVGLKNLKNRSFPIFSLPKTKQVIIINCCIEDLGEISRWQLPQAQQIILVSSFSLKVPIFNFPRLQKFRCCYYQQLQPLQVQDAIQNLRSYQNSQKMNSTTTHSLKSQINILDKQKDDLSNLAMWDCINLKTIVLKNLCLVDIPKIQMLELQHLIIRQCFIETMNQFKNSLFPSLLLFVFYKVKGLVSWDLSQNFTFGGRISIQQNDIQRIDNFKDPNCKQIILRGNRIKQIKNICLDETEMLDISDNRLQNISFITRASKLKILSLSYNNIFQLPQIQFPSLTEFTIGNNNLTRLYLSQQHYPVLQNIEFYCNKITKLERLKLKNLQKLVGYENQIGDLDFFQDLNSSLSFVDLGGNKIHHITKFPKTKQLYLYLNPIQNLRWLNLNDTSILQTLIVSSTNVDDFKIFGFFNQKFSELIKLDLHDNKANYFPTSSSIFLKLQQLDLSENKFTEIDQFSPNNYPHLQKLNLNNNKLRYFKSSLFKLKYLFLNDNQLHTLDLSPNVLQVIRELQVNNNNLERIDIMAKCPRLWKLSAKNNKINSLPEISSNYSLKVFIVSLNPINDFQRFLQSKFDQLDPIQFQYSTDPQLPMWVSQLIKKLIYQNNFERVEQIKSTLQLKKQPDNFNFISEAIRTKQER